MFERLDSNASAASLIAEKYAEDGADVVKTYQQLRFGKHIELMRQHMGLVEGTRVLDVGCGTGALLVELVQAGAIAIGLDTFEEHEGIDLRIAEARMREAGVEATLLQASATALPFETNTFDISTSIGMLEHLPPDVRRLVLQEMFRVLRPGGQILLIAGPTLMTPLDQHIPGHLFSNWYSRARKIKIAERSGRRQFLAVPWGISRRELRNALPDAEFRSLYGKYFSLKSSSNGSDFRFTPFGLLAWAKRRFRMDVLFGSLAAGLYVMGLEHCHILSIRKPSPAHAAH